VALVKDIVAVTGKYKNKEGVEKSKYLTVGKLIAKDDGNQFMVLEAWFNPMAVCSADKDGNRQVMLNIFEQKAKDGKSSESEKPALKGDDIPF
jgi:hypothetical protein